MRRVITSMKMLAASAVVLSTATIVSVAGASGTFSTSRPSFCDTGFYRSACAQILNDTQGFAPGSSSPSVAHGFALTWNGFQEGDCAKCANYIHSKTIQPGTVGGANIASYGGVVSGAIGAIRYTADTSIFGASGAENTWWLDVPHSGANHADCRIYLSQYLTCTEQWTAEHGTSKDAWWNWTVVDRPYALSIRNFTAGRLVGLGHPALMDAIDNMSGMHTAGNIPADNGTPGHGTDTGLLTTNAGRDAQLNFEYEVVGGPHNGAVLTIHIKVAPTATPATTDEGKSGNQENGSYCNVSGANTGGLNCEVPRFTPVKNGFNRLSVLVN